MNEKDRGIEGLIPLGDVCVPGTVAEDVEAERLGCLDEQKLVHR